jgi:kumamolisin
VSIRPYVKRPRALSGPWTVPALCAAYHWPAGLEGGGVIAIVELGGGWTAADMATFFQGVGQPLPSITDISVDGTRNSPGASDADLEVALDIQVAAASYYVATGKAAEIRVYWAGDIGLAVQKAAEDGCDVCSISWGADEADWGKAAVLQMEQVAEAATGAGMVIFAAAGDNDASDGGATPANVDCPASCPHVVGCGGTSKSPSAEVVWNNDPDPTDPKGEGTGGGYSTVFPAQTFQQGAPMPPAGLGRMVPDVSANADPQTGYLIVSGGAQMVVGGTSAVAPLYAGLFAAFGKKLGFVSPGLWANEPAFIDITVGGNGLYDASVGPDACTGLGTPLGTKLAALYLQGAPPPVPSPPPPAGPSLAEAQKAIAGAFVHHFLLFRHQAIALASIALARVLDPTTSPSFAMAVDAVTKALMPYPWLWRGEATLLADKAIQTIWP